MSKHITAGAFINEASGPDLLLAVGQLAVLANGHGLLLDVVLSEQSRLSSHHLRDGSWNYHVLYAVIIPPRLPALWRNHLVKETDC